MDTVIQNILNKMLWQCGAICQILCLTKFIKKTNSNEQVAISYSISHISLL